MVNADKVRYYYKIEETYSTGLKTSPESSLG